MIVLIPAYEPGAPLVDLVRELRLAEPGIAVLVVDDGSGPRFAHVFAAAATEGAEVLQHPRNRGKGEALKTGFVHVIAQHPDSDVVTADADGQHTVADILAVVAALRADADSGTCDLVLGCRSFVGDVPARSRVGNTIARTAFRLAAGWSLTDTQTGLRGIPAEMLPWLSTLPGARFEYELRMLVRLRRDGYSAREVPIQTVYLEANASSHYRPVRDSLRVMTPLLLFSGSSVLAFFIDTVALLLMTWLTGWLVVSIITARAVSASANFAINRRWVFAHRERRRIAGEAVRYAALAAALLASNIVWITALTGLGVPLLPAKLLTEIVLFVTSYQVQRRVVFGRSEFVITAQKPHRKRIARVAVMESTPHEPRRNS